MLLSVRTGLLIFGTLSLTVQADQIDASKRDQWITFVSHRAGYNQVFRMRPDGRELQPIFGGKLIDHPIVTKGRELYCEPHWTRLSPDRKYFLSWASDVGTPRQEVTPVRFMIHLGTIDGKWSRVVRADGEEVFAWAPDSKRFAYAERNGRVFRDRQLRTTRIYIANADGLEQYDLLERRGYWDVEDWSPDSNYLLLSHTPYGQTESDQWKLATQLLEFQLPPLEAKAPSESTEFMVRPKAESVPGLRSIVTAPVANTLLYARYSLDGESIAAVELLPSEDPANAPTRLVLIKRKTGELSVLVANQEGVRGPLCWSPDSSEVLYSCSLSPSDDREKIRPAVDGEAVGLGIWAVDVRSHETRFITTGWCPDWR